MAKHIHIHVHRAVRDRKGKDAQTREELEARLVEVQEKIERLEDQGVTVPVAMREERRRLQEELKKVK